MLKIPGLPNKKRMIWGN